MGVGRESQSFWSNEKYLAFDYLDFVFASKAQCEKTSHFPVNILGNTPQTAATIINLGVTFVTDISVSELVRLVGLAFSKSTTSHIIRQYLPVSSRV